MPAKRKIPFGKIALVGGVALAALIVIWLAVANPFAKEEKPTTNLYIDRPIKNDSQDNQNQSETNDVSNDFTSFEEPSADSGLDVKDSDQAQPYYEDNQTKSSTTNENNYQENIIIVNQTPPPAPEIYAAPARSTTKKTISFSFRGQKGASFRCSLNRSDYQDATSCQGGKTYSNLNYSKKYAFRVWQVNRFGERSYAPARYKFYLKNPNPPARPTIISAPNQYTNKTSIKFQFEGVTNNFKCSLNNSYFKQASDCGSPKSYNNLSDGRYVFRVWQVRDQLKSKQPAKRVFYVDRTAPAQPTITSAPPAETSATSQTFEFIGESKARFQCAIDGGTLFSCSSPYISNLGVGDYVFSVWQTDRAGNRSLEPAQSLFSVVESHSSLSLRSGPYRGVQGYQSDSAQVDGYQPVNQETSEDSDVTLDVLAAIELAVPGDDSDKVAPVAGGAADANIGFSTSADLRSNLGWSVATTLNNAKLRKGGTGTGLLSNFDTGAQGTENRSGNRNNSNAAQTYAANYDQDVSWGDEAGSYSVVATHTASQTLGN